MQLQMMNQSQTPGGQDNAGGPTENGQGFNPQMAAASTGAQANMMANPAMFSMGGFPQMMAPPNGMDMSAMMAPQMGQGFMTP